MPIIACVTGANRGIGLALTRQLIRRGDRVIATARDPKGCAAFAEMADTGRLHPIALDVADDASLAALPERVAALTDRVDLLINNAGVNGGSVPEGGPNRDWGALEPVGMLSMMRVNAVGPLLVTQALVELLAAGTDPRVLCVSSQLGSLERKTDGGGYGYCMSKAALNMGARAMAADIRERGIVAVAVHPGWVITDMGGPNAELTPEQSASGLLNLAAELGPDDAGRFFKWNGDSHPW